MPTIVCSWRLFDLEKCYHEGQGHTLVLQYGTSVTLSIEGNYEYKTSFHRKKFLSILHLYASRLSTTICSQKLPNPPRNDVFGKYKHTHMHNARVDFIVSIDHYHSCKCTSSFHPVPVQNLLLNYLP